MTIHFGKYKGTKISEIPSSYLKWILRDYTANTDILNEVRSTLLDRMLQEHTFEDEHNSESDYLDSWPDNM